MNKKAFRPDWDHYFMAIAHMIAERSTCDRAKIGAVLVKDRRLIASGYNGSPPNMDHCDDVGHLMEEGHCIRTLHAEENTLLQAAKLGISTEGSTVYCTHSPCYHCFKKIIATGVKRVIVANMYRDNDIPDAFRQAGVMFDLYKPDPKWQNHVSELFRNLPKE